MSLDSNDKHTEPVLEYIKRYSQNQNLPKYLSGSPVSYLPPIVTEVDATDSRVLEAIQAKHSSSSDSSSSSESHSERKKLEWDNGADIGYNSTSNKRTGRLKKSLSLPESLSNAISKLKNMPSSSTVSNEDVLQSSSEENIEIIVLSSETSSAKSSARAQIDEQLAKSSANKEDAKVLEFHKQINYLKRKIGLPDAQSTPNTEIQTKDVRAGRVQLSSRNSKISEINNLIEEKLQVRTSSSSKSSSSSLEPVKIQKNIKTRVVELNISTPINVKCVKPIDSKTVHPQAIQTESVRCRSIETQCNFQENYEMVDSASSFEYIKVKPGNSKVVTLREPIEVASVVDQHLETLRNLLKSKTFNSSAKRKYIKRLLKELNELETSNETSTSSDLFIPKKVVNSLNLKSDSKSKPVQNKTNGSENEALNCLKSVLLQASSSSQSNSGSLRCSTKQNTKIIPRNCNYSNLSKAQSASEESSEKDSRMHSNDHLVKFAENEREYQLHWINNEINHLSKLKHILETKKTSKSRTNVYNVAQEGGTYRQYVIDCPERIKCAKYLIDGKKYVVSDSQRDSTDTENSIIADIVVKSNEKFTNIKVRTLCLTCRQAQCICGSERTLESRIPSLSDDGASNVCPSCHGMLCVCERIDCCEQNLNSLEQVFEKCCCTYDRPNCGCEFVKRIMDKFQIKRPDASPVAVQTSPIESEQINLQYSSETGNVNSQTRTKESQEKKLEITKLAQHSVPNPEKGNNEPQIHTSLTQNINLQKVNNNDHVAIHTIKEENLAKFTQTELASSSIQHDGFYKATKCCSCSTDNLISVNAGVTQTERIQPDIAIRNSEIDLKNFGTQHERDLIHAGVQTRPKKVLRNFEGQTKVDLESMGVQTDWEYARTFSKLSKATSNIQLVASPLEKNLNTDRIAMQDTETQASASYATSINEARDEIVLKNTETQLGEAINYNKDFGTQSIHHHSIALRDTGTQPTDRLLDIKPKTLKDSRTQYSSSSSSCTKDFGMQSKTILMKNTGTELLGDENQTSLRDSGTQYKSIRLTDMETQRSETDIKPIKITTNESGAQSHQTISLKDTGTQPSGDSLKNFGTQHSTSSMRNRKSSSTQHIQNGFFKDSGTQFEKISSKSTATQSTDESMSADKKKNLLRDSGTQPDCSTEPKLKMIPKDSETQHVDKSQARSLKDSGTQYSYDYLTTDQTREMGTQFSKHRIMLDTSSTPEVTSRKDLEIQANTLKDTGSEPPSKGNLTPDFKDLGTQHSNTTSSQPRSRPLRDIGRQHSVATDSLSTNNTTTNISNSSGSTRVICFCCKQKAFLAEVSYLEENEKSFPICTKCFYTRPRYCSHNYCWTYPSCHWQPTICRCYSQNPAVNKRKPAPVSDGLMYTVTLRNSINHSDNSMKRNIEDVKVQQGWSWKNMKNKENYIKKNNGDTTEKKHKKREHSNGNANEKDCVQYTLMEYLIRNKPGFITTAEYRRQMLLNSRIMRERQKDDKKLHFLENNEKFENQSKYKLFTEKQMKQITRKNYEKLPEVKKKFINKRVNRLRLADRLISNVFAKKVQKSILQGKGNFPIDRPLTNIGNTDHLTA